jgi:hypothetical protein
MNKVFSVAVLVVFVCGCQISAQPASTISTSATTPASLAPTTFSSSLNTPTIPSAVVSTSRPAATTLPAPRSTPTIRPATITPSPPLPTTPPTSALVEGWFVYQNDLLGYEISYPPKARISSRGADGYFSDDLPPVEAFGPKTFNYLARLEQIYPDDLCVEIEYEGGFIGIGAPRNRGGQFVFCTVGGPGAVDLIPRTETIVIGGQPYSATGSEIHARDVASTSAGGFLGTSLEDGTHIFFSLPVTEITKQILASYRQTSRAPACASNWSQLYPGIFAVVTDGQSNLPNRVRSAPDTRAEVITQIYPGQIVLVLEGPTCAGDLVFWKVESDAIPGGLGWTAEGAGAEYYLEPYKR